ELLAHHAVFLQLAHGDGELAGVLAVFHRMHGGVEADLVAQAAAFDPPHDVVAQHRPRRIRRDGPAEVLFEAVVGELQALLRAVRPQVAVHARVHGLAVLVQAGAPGVVPHSPEIGLLLEADDFRDFGTRAAGGIEGAKLGQAAGAGAEYGDTLGHVVCHLLSGARPTGAYPRAKSAKHRPGMETTPTGVRRPALRATRGGPREKSCNSGGRPPGARRMPDMDTGRGTPSTARARSSKQTRSSVICTKCRAIITRTHSRQGRGFSRRSRPRAAHAPWSRACVPSRCCATSRRRRC